MNILLIAATAVEIEPFLNAYRRGEMDAGQIDICITGIGLNATTYSIMKQLQIKRPSLVVQAGIAGCFDERVKKGSVFMVKKDTIADLGVMEKGQLQTVFDMKLVQANQFPYSKGWLINRNPLLQKLPYRKVSSISVNAISTGKSVIQQYRDHFTPVLESMEGAALHYTCLQEGIPFLQLRAVSNYVGERNKKKWAFRESIENLNNALIQLLPCV